MTVSISKPSINLREKLSELSNNGTAATRDHGTEANEVPLNSDLGTAATEDVTTSATDSTAGRLLKVGDFGLGAAYPEAIADLNEFTLGGMYRFTTATTNQPTAAGNGQLMTVVFDPNDIRQFVYYKNNDSQFTRRSADGAWQAWQEIHHTGNLQNTTTLGLGVVRLMYNNSGGVIGENSSVSGSALKIAIGTTTGFTTSTVTVTGTWKQVLGTICNASTTGYFVRTA